MTDTPMTPNAALARLRQYGERTSTWSTATYNDGPEKALHEIALTLAVEVERLRAVSDQLDFLDRNTLPELHRKIQHHQDGKARWRGRAEKAEARVAVLEGAESRLARVERVVDEAEDKDMDRIDRWELRDALAGLEEMRAERPAPCRVPDSPDCTCPAGCETP